MNDVNVNGQYQLRPFLLSTKDVLSGEYIEEAFVAMSRRDNFGGQEEPVVSFRMSPVGAPLLGALTEANIGHYMAIVLDGVVKSAPVLQGNISDSGQITLGAGSYEEKAREANDLAVVLRAGALPATIEVQEERVIGPSIGRDAITAGKNAMGLAFGVVVLFLALYYSTSGIIGAFITLVNVAMIVAVLGTLGATLTLPGIAGIVLTIGMAVDALIIIFERMREELRAGRTVRQTISLGFENAFAAILDSNVTTAMGAFVLLQYGTGSIRGFALTLLVGITVNVFLATFYARSIYDALFQSNVLKTVRVGIGRKNVSREAHAS